MSYFIQGLLPRIRYTLAEQMKNFVEQERGSMLTARRVAAAEWRSVRARFGDPGGRLRPTRSPDTTTTGSTRRSSRKLVPTMACTRAVVKRSPRKREKEQTALWTFGRR